MKKSSVFLTTFFTTLTSTLIAQSTLAQSFGFVMQKRTPIFVALNCDAKLTLRETHSWLKAGAKLPPELISADTRGDFDLTLTLATKYADQASASLGFLMFRQDFKGAMSNAEFAEDASFNAPAMGLPSVLDTCAALPLAVDVSRLRKGAAYLVDNRIFQKLSPLDKIFARLLFNGFRFDSIAALIDERSHQGTSLERVERALAVGFPAVNLDGIEITLDRNNLRRYKSGAIASLSSIDKKGDSIAEYQFRENGFASKIYGHGGFKSELNLKLAKGDIPNAVKSGDKSVSCSKASYLKDGSLLVCDHTIFRDSVEISSELRGTIERFQNYGPSDTKGWSASKSIDLAVVVPSIEGGASGTILEGITKPVKSIETLVGDESCSRTTFKNTVFKAAKGEWVDEDRPKIKNYDIELSLPDTCVGAIRLKF